MQTGLSHVADSTRMSAAPGQYTYNAPLVDNPTYFVDGINSASDRVGGNVIDAESKLRGLGVALSKYDSIRESPPTLTATRLTSMGASLDAPVVKTKTLQRGTDRQQWGLRPVYPVDDLVQCTPVRNIVSEWGMNTRDVARQSCE